MSYKFDSIVNRSEAQALKEMIFKRVNDRSKSIEENTQNDIMDLARSSFVSKNNPFTQILEGTKPVDILELETPKSSDNNELEPALEDHVNDVKNEEKINADLEVGFPIRESELKVVGENKIINEQIAKATVASTMQEARAELSNKKSFMGALNFLNTQAAISLVRTRADKFEILV